MEKWEMDGNFYPKMNPLEFAVLCLGLSLNAMIFWHVVALRSDISRLKQSIEQLNTKNKTK